MLAGFFLWFILVDNRLVSSFADKIKQKALEIGFHKIGIVPAAALTDEATRLRTWLENDFHGGMAWMEREPEKRTDPKLIFPDAKSMIVLALNYYTPHEHPEDPEKGKISRYAWGDDYHDVVKEKLRVLLDWIKLENPEADGKLCVDTAPVMDKAWAVRAGLGWMGKHTSIAIESSGMSGM